MSSVLRLVGEDLDLHLHQEGNIAIVSADLIPSLVSRPEPPILELVGSGRSLSLLTSPHLKLKFTLQFAPSTRTTQTNTRDFQGVAGRMTTIIQANSDGLVNISSLPRGLYQVSVLGTDAQGREVESESIPMAKATDEVDYGTTFVVDYVHETHYSITVDSVFMNMAAIENMSGKVVARLFGNGPLTFDYDNSGKLPEGDYTIIAYEQQIEYNDTIELGRKSVTLVENQDPNLFSIDTNDYYWSGYYTVTAGELYGVDFTLKNDEGDIVGEFPNDNSGGFVINYGNFGDLPNGGYSVEFTYKGQTYNFPFDLVDKLFPAPTVQRIGDEVYVNTIPRAEVYLDGPTTVHYTADENGDILIQYHLDSGEYTVHAERDGHSSETTVVNL